MQKETGDRVMRLRRIFLALFLMEIGIYLIVSSLNLNNPTLLTSFTKSQQAITSQDQFAMFLSIFLHNLLVATIEFIPILGLLFFVISSVETSIVISLEGSAYHVSGLAIFASLSLYPHTWLELPAYAIASASGIYLLYLIIKRGDVLRGNIRKILYMYLFVVLELGIAGAFESTEIVMLGSYPSPDNVLYPLALWIPGIPALWMLIILFRRINRNEYVKKTEEEGKEGPDEGDAEATYMQF